MAVVRSLPFCFPLISLCPLIWLSHRVCVVCLFIFPLLLWCVGFAARGLFCCVLLQGAFTFGVLVVLLFVIVMLRSYPHESSPSHQNWELKRE
jgi:hypothetical protein